MPRPIEYDRAEIIEKAMKLFWVDGYEQTSVRDVLDATGFNRHSLYEEFGGKDGLFKVVLDHYQQTVAFNVIKLLKKKNSDIETIREVFRNRSKFDQKKIGCLISNTANSKYAINEDLYGAIQTYNVELEQAFEICIANAQQKGQVPKDKDAKLLSRFMTTIFHGLSPMSKLGIARKETVSIGELAIQALVAE